MPILNLIFPYNPDLSENFRLAWNPKIGRMYAKNGYKTAKSALILAISFVKAQKRALFEPRTRVFVTLRVYRPGGQSDASNYIKSTNDAIAEAIGVNDHFFDGSYYGFVDKKNPRFEIDIKQCENKKGE